MRGRRLMIKAYDEQEGKYWYLMVNNDYLLANKKLPFTISAQGSKTLINYFIKIESLNWTHLIANGIVRQHEWR